MQLIDSGWEIEVIGNPFIAHEDETNTSVAIDIAGVSIVGPDNLMGSVVYWTEQDLSDLRDCLNKLLGDNNA